MRLAVDWRPPVLLAQRYRKGDRAMAQAAIDTASNPNAMNSTAPVRTIRLNIGLASR